jgi:hypothetical protein
LPIYFKSYVRSYTYSFVILVRYTGTLVYAGGSAVAEAFLNLVAGFRKETQL